MNTELINSTLYHRLTHGFGRCRGTFGELMQGVLPDSNTSFLVTLPIALYSTARFTGLANLQQISVFPAHKAKAKRIAEMLLDLLDVRSGGILSIQSELEEGKGCASSSADLMATARAVQSFFHVSLSQEAITKMMCEIEPTDGVMYDKVVSFHYCTGILGRDLGLVPPLTIVSVDEGGSVDSVEFEESRKLITNDEKKMYDGMLNSIEQAMISRDLRLVGQIATKSAVMNQKYLPKRLLERFVGICESNNLLGVAVAHSGTYIGILLDPLSEKYDSDMSKVLRDISDLNDAVRIFHTMDPDASAETTTT